jgi:hypothetical protein
MFALDVTPTSAVQTFIYLADFAPDRPPPTDIFSIGAMLRQNGIRWRHLQVMSLPPVALMQVPTRSSALLTVIESAFICMQQTGSTQVANVANSCEDFIGRKSDISTRFAQFNSNPAPQCPEMKRLH